jgi:hypothetical protein
VERYSFLDVDVEFIHGLALRENVLTNRCRPRFLQALQFLVPFMLSRSLLICHSFIGAEAV